MAGEHDTQFVEDVGRSISLSELHAITRCPIKVMSGYNGKTLAKRYNPNKHKSLSGREVISQWAEVEVAGTGWNKSTTPVICVYLHGDVEYELSKLGVEK